MKNTKKIIALVIAVLLLVTCLSACGSESSGLEALKKKGYLTIATSPDYPPFESLDDNGNVIGIETDIMQLICDELGVELKVEQIQFDSVLPGVQAGKYDAGVSGITITEERQKNSLFTDPYCMAAQAIVVMEDSGITCKADLEGKTISVQTGTTAEIFCMNEGYNVSAFNTNSDAESAVTTAKVDAWVIDDLTAVAMVEEYNAQSDTKLVILDERMTSEPYGFAFKLGNDEVVNEINTILAKLIEDGTVAEIFEKYGALYTAPTK